MVMPGDNITVDVELRFRSRWKSACAAIRARRTVGAGIVAAIIE